MIRPRIQWTAPAPLWPQLAAASGELDRADFRRPTILRFASDDFMNEFLNVLAIAPCRLGDWQAVWETWREPAPTPTPVELLPNPIPLLAEQVDVTAADNGASLTTEQPSPDEQAVEKKLKLYQPAHQRFYLVTACLVCRLPGMPDRMLDANKGEQATFVIRRLKRQSESQQAAPGPPSVGNLDQFDEYAFVQTPQGYQWKLLQFKTQSPPEEERMPLFGVPYSACSERRRRLLAGLIPVGKREAYVGTVTAPPENGSTSESLKDPREVLFLSDVVQPWRTLIEQDEKFKTQHGDSADAVEVKVREELGAAGETDEKINAVVTLARADFGKELQKMAEQAQISSWYILLDLATFLKDHVRNVWLALPDEIDKVEGAELELLQKLRASTLAGHTLAEALVEIEKHGPQLEGAMLAYEEVGSVGDEFWKPVLTYTVDDPPWLESFILTDFADHVKEQDHHQPSPLEDIIAAVFASESESTAVAPPLSLAAQQQAIEGRESDWYIIRCVFDRPYCVLPSFLVVSEPSVPFQLANFFDPEAPARPIRISLPLDTSPAGLRKFAKNTAFVMSDILACQIGQVRNITLADLVLSVLPWPFHKSLPEPTTGPCREEGADVGMVCSLSIPIVTLCALILLIVIVNLFESFFGWIKYFIVCFPLPGWKGKEDI